MEKIINPGKINGRIFAPPSKSMMQRAVAMGIMATQPYEILNPSLCNDGISALATAASFGKEIETLNDRIALSGNFNISSKYANVGESGLGIRMFSIIAALGYKEIVLLGEGSLVRRPVHILEPILEQVGADCYTNSGFIPVTICGPITGGNVFLDGSSGSQVLTGLLMALPFAGENSEIEVRNLKSIPYIEMTLEFLSQSGIEIENEDFKKFFVRGNQSVRNFSYTVEGDWSSAAFLLVAGGISGKVEVSGLRLDSKQADKSILEVLKKAGAQVITENKSIICKKDKLKSFEFDASNCPDLFPPIAVLAANCEGTSVIKGTERLIHKESNRAETLKLEFEKLGIEIDYSNDMMKITGGKIRGGEFFSHNDHRIAMAGACMAINSSNAVKIFESQTVAKSWPSFYMDFESLKEKIIK